MSILVALLVIMVFSREATGKTKYYGSTRGCDSACQQECIEVINKYRRNHSAPPLTFSRTLANKAQKWADRGRFGYDMNSRGKYGQIIEWDVKDELPNFTSVVKHWHDNAKDFDFTTGKSKTGKTLHDFTQIVWKRARMVGCARSEMFGSKFYVVWMDSDGVVSPKMGIGKENVGAPKEDDSEWFELKQNANGGYFMSGSGVTEQGVATMRTFVAEDGNEGEVGRARKKSAAGEGAENVDVNEVENEQRILSNNIKDYLMDDEHSLNDVIHNENKDTANIQNEFQGPGNQGKTADDVERILNQAGRTSDVSGGGQLSTYGANFHKKGAGGLAESNSIRQTGQYFDSTTKTSARLKGHDVAVNITVPKKPLQPPVAINITSGKNSSNYTRSNNDYNNNNDNNNNNNNNNNNIDNNGDVMAAQPPNDSKVVRPVNSHTMKEVNNNINNNNQIASQQPGKETALSSDATDLNFNQNGANSNAVNNNSNNNNQRASQQPGKETVPSSDAAQLNFNQNSANSIVVNNNNNDHHQDNRESAQPEKIFASSNYNDLNTIAVNNNKNNNNINNNNIRQENMESSQPEKETASSNHIVDSNYNHNYASNSAVNNNNGNRQDNRVNSQPAEETAPSNHNAVLNYGQNNPQVNLNPSKPISIANSQDIRTQMKASAGDKVENGMVMQHQNNNNYNYNNSNGADRNGTNSMAGQMEAKQLLQANALKNKASQFSRISNLISLRLASLPKTAQTANYGTKPNHEFSGESGNDAALGRKPGHEVLSAQVDFAASPSKPSLVIRLNDSKVKFKHLSGEKLKLLASPSEFSKLKSLSDKTPYFSPGKNSSLVTSSVPDGKAPNLAALPNEGSNTLASPGNHNSLVASHDTSATTPGQLGDSTSLTFANTKPNQAKGSQPIKIEAVGEALMLLPSTNAVHIANRKLPNLISGVERTSGTGADDFNNAEGQKGKDVNSNLAKSGQPSVNSNLAPLSRDAHAPGLSEGPASAGGAETSPGLLGQYKHGTLQGADNDSKKPSSFQENQNLKGGTIDYDKSKTKDVMASYLSSKLHSAGSADTEEFTLPKVVVYADNPARPGRAQCKDDTAMCSVWMAHRGCKDTTYAAFMRQHCKATCGYCALPSEVKMNDEAVHQEAMKNDVCRDAASYAFSCPRWRFGGYCDKKPKEMKIFCRKTCGFCEENTLPLASDQPKVGSHDVENKAAEISPQAPPETKSSKSQTYEASPPSVNSQENNTELTAVASHAALGETNSSSPGHLMKGKLDEYISKGVADLQRKLKAEIHVSAVAKSTHPAAVAAQSKNNIPDVAKEPVETKAKIQDTKPVATDGCDMRCQKECLHAHNVYRANHGAPPLQLDPTLAQQAQSWANKKVFKHSPWASGTGGESIALGNLYPTYTAAVKAWHDEEKDFDWSKGSSVNGRKVAHFTQVVWKKATLLGCGKTTVNGEPYYIAQMDIPGVIAETEPGYGRDNVEKPRKSDLAWFMDSSPYWKDLQTKDSIIKNIDHYIL